MRLVRFYKYYGINIKICYVDFDKYYIGVVIESQVNISIVVLINIYYIGDIYSIIYRQGLRKLF